MGAAPTNTFVRSFIFGGGGRGGTCSRRSGRERETGFCGQSAKTLWGGGGGREEEREAYRRKKGRKAFYFSLYPLVGGEEKGSRHVSSSCGLIFGHIRRFFLIFCGSRKASAIKSFIFCQG